MPLSPSLKFRGNNEIKSIIFPLECIVISFGKQGGRVESFVTVRIVRYSKKKVELLSASVINFGSKNATQENNRRISRILFCYLKKYFCRSFYCSILCFWLCQPYLYKERRMQRVRKNLWVEFQKKTRRVKGEKVTYEKCQD